jgi:TonB family protein
MKNLSLLVGFILLNISVLAQDSTAVPAAAPAIAYDVQPSYVGGEQKMFQFLIANFKYPPAALRDKVGGIVQIAFDVDVDGKLSNFAVQKGVRKDLNAEALRVCRLMPKWKPATLQGRPVKIRYLLPINFGQPK